MAENSKDPEKKKRARGKNWTREELSQVLGIYPQVKDRIHEKNEVIQDLAETLGRGVRGVEAQLIMFRCLDRGEEYPWGKMSTLCRELWQEEMGEPMGKLGPPPPPKRKIETVAEKIASDDRQGEQDLFPNRFVSSWLAHGSGGIRRPFVSDSGRPLGETIETPLVKKLRDLASVITNGEQEAQVVMLVGGPGNGKSDAIEEFLRAFGKNSSDPETSQKKLRKLFSNASTRAVEIAVEEYMPGIKADFDTIRVVQDASEGDEDGHSAGDLLLRDCADILAPNKKTLFVCCVNRGILDAAWFKARNKETKTEVRELIEDCFTAIQPACPGSPCWPLENNPVIFIWPMDVESLCDGSADEKSVVLQILGKSIVEESWSGLGDEGCPFIANRLVLADVERREAMGRMLKDEEVITGRRWTFRQLFDLVAWLFTGGEIRKDKGPIEWSADKRKSAIEGSPKERLVAKLDLFRATYPQVLFPRWPNTKQFAKDIETLGADENSLLQALAAYLANTNVVSGSTIGQRLASSWSNNHDPALGCSEDWIPSLGENDVTVRELEDAFSQSVRNGHKMCRLSLNFLENQALDLMEDIEDEIDNLKQDAPKKQAAAISAVAFVRRLAVVVTKRALAVRDGFGLARCKVNEFLDCLIDQERFNDEIEQLDNVISEVDSSYVVPLYGTFGQPRVYAANGPRLLVDPPNFVTKSEESSINQACPPWQLMKFNLDCSNDINVEIDYTFQLFERLRANRLSMHPGCLDRMLDGCLDRARSILDGHAVRMWGNKNGKFKVDMQGWTLSPKATGLRATRTDD